MHAGKRNPPEASLTFARMRPAAFLIPQKCEVISMATAFAPDECTMATKALTSAAHRNCFEPSSSTINTSPPGTPILPATCLSVPEPSCLISLRSEAFASNAASRSSRSIRGRGSKASTSCVSCGRTHSGRGAPIVQRRVTDRACRRQELVTMPAHAPRIIRRQPRGTSRCSGQ